MSAAAAAAVAEAEAAADAEANEEVENLLESYFMQIDRTYNRLKSLQEFMACEPETPAWNLADTPRPSLDIDRMSVRCVVGMSYALCSSAVPVLPQQRSPELA